MKDKLIINECISNIGKRPIDNDDIIKQQFEYILLDYNYLSSPKRLIEYQIQYFEEDLKPIRLEKIKKIRIKNNNIEVFEINSLNE